MKNDSGHGGSDSGPDAANNHYEDEEGMYITPDPSPSVIISYVIWSRVSCHVISCPVFSYLISHISPILLCFVLAIFNLYADGHVFKYIRS